jgi:all-trans-8'-apo-beta-carotenal 15,15'-oxygenase
VSAESTDYAPGLEVSLLEIPAESSHLVEPRVGSLPSWLRGTCYWNGPARFERGGFRYQHWLDGDGMVSALRLSDDGARFSNRFVRSSKYLAEEEAGKPLYRTFGTCFPGDALARGIGLESPVNVSVIPFAGTLLACGEQGIPWELDPLSLETKGPYTFNRALNPISPFAAHAKIDPATGDLVNFGLSYSRHQPCVHIYRFDSAGHSLSRRRIPLGAPYSVHDFCLADGYAVFHLGPYLLELDEVVTAGRSIFEALRWDGERPSELLVVPHDASAEPVRVPLPGGYCLHGIGAALDEAGHLVVDFVELDRPIYDQYLVLPELLADVCCGRPVRLVVDLANAQVIERRPLPYENAPDFPVRHVRAGAPPEPDVWMLGISTTGRRGRKFYDQLMHGRWDAAGDQVEIWQAPPGRYLTSEPALATGPQGESALLCLMFDANRRESLCLLFDPERVRAGPQVEIPLGRVLPPAFHAAFAPAEP